MRKRNSKIFGILEESPKTELKIITKVPDKWILIDTETMQIFKGSKDSFEIGKMWNSLKCKFTINLENE